MGVAYSSIRVSFMKKLQKLFMMTFNRSYVLGSELWESKFDGLLSLVKEYIVDMWEIRKHKLYDSDSRPGQLSVFTWGSSCG